VKGGREEMGTVQRTMSSFVALRRVPVMSSPNFSRTLAVRTVLATFALLAGALPGLLALDALFAQDSSVGLSAVRGQRFDNEPLQLFVPEQIDLFAWAVAAGDFNGDGADDLATGIPYDEGFTGSGCTDCGIVVVRYGIPGKGLATSATSTVLFQGLVGSPTVPEAAEKFGYALAAGDFNGDGYDDLAVGIPEERHPDFSNVPIGAVEVHYGSAGGLLVQPTDWIHRYSVGWEIPPSTCPVAPDEFGAALAAGNFNGDAFDDLAIGAPIGCPGTAEGAPDGGAVYVAHGGAAGLLPLVGYLISEDSFGFFGDAANGERFGDALAAGDFDGDLNGGFDDLAIGVPGEGDNGSVYVVLGSEFGLIFATSVFWAPGALGIPPEAGARLGAALAAGDFDGDGHDDLVIGDPYQDLGLFDEIIDAGLIVFAFGSPAGFDLSRTVHGIDPEGIDANDRFGWALAVGDFDRDGLDDIAVGAPLEDADVLQTGSVSILMGENTSGVGTRQRTFLSGREGIPGGEQSHQNFGSALAVGDFDGDAHADLVIGAPYFNIAGVGDDVGMEVVLYGSLFADGFEAAGMQNWSASAP
jgi:hypothetical protein